MRPVSVPVAAHAAASRVCKPDEVIRAAARTGGVLGITAVRQFVRTKGPVTNRPHPDRKPRRPAGARPSRPAGPPVPIRQPGSGAHGTSRESRRRRIGEGQPFFGDFHLFFGGMQCIERRADIEFELFVNIVGLDALLAELGCRFRTPRIAPATVEDRHAQDQPRNRGWAAKIRCCRWFRWCRNRRKAYKLGRRSPFTEWAFKRAAACRSASAFRSGRFFSASDISGEAC